MARTKRAAPDPTRAIAYLRVSTDEQVDSGLGLASQRAAVEAECHRRGWELVEVFEDAGASGKSMAGRVGMAAALSALEAGEGGVLVAAKLDRLTRSVVDAAALLERAQRDGWSLVALDLGVDTTTPAGELVGHVMAAVAQWERRAIGARTREALAAKRAQGIRLGRPLSLSEPVADRIVAAHKLGNGWSDIAADLNARRVPTARGGARWFPSTVRAVYMARRQEDVV